ncbi:MAG: FAD-dependent oxidoreductase [Gammaproteobacteria bacterium]
MEKTDVTTDMVIFGGGIAGLWLLHKLKALGFSAILLETATLGGGQTSKSQGIIHGGMKYALQGVLTSEAQAMSDLPARWRACFQGSGEVDLSAVPILSAHHYLWSPSRIAAKLGGFLAGATLMSKVKSLAKKDYPDAFQHPKFKGDVYALDEIVIDVPALIKVLTEKYADAIFKIDTMQEDDLHLDAQGQLSAVTIHNVNQCTTLHAKHFIFTAGAGNEFIIQKIRQPSIAMQRRPLHMVMVKLPFDYAVYAHCLGFGARPRLTITTHHLPDGSAVWYLGGLLAEEGVRRDQAAQIKAAKKELTSLFSWLDFSEAEFASFFIDRAEPLQKGGLKPDTSFVSKFNNMIIAWPTKLALAPKLADEIIKQLQASPSAQSDLSALQHWAKPALATPIWEEAFCKNDS